MGVIEIMALAVAVGLLWLSVLLGLSTSAAPAKRSKSRCRLFAHWTDEDRKLYAGSLTDALRASVPELADASDGTLDVIARSSLAVAEMTDSFKP